MGLRLKEFLAGCRDEAPLQLGVIPFGMLYGIGAVAAVEYGIPAVIGATGNLDALTDGLPVIVDATTGQVSEWKK